MTEPDFIGRFIENWKDIATWSISLLGIAAACVYRYKQLDENKRKRAAIQAKKKEELALQIRELQKDLEAANARIDKLSNLCQDQIKSNKIAYGKAMRVEGRLDERGYYADKA